MTVAPYARPGMEQRCRAPGSRVAASLNISPGQWPQSGRGPGEGSKPPKRQSRIAAALSPTTTHAYIHDYEIRRNERYKKTEWAQSTHFLWNINACNAALVTVAPYARPGMEQRRRAPGSRVAASLNISPGQWPQSGRGPGEGSKPPKRQSRIAAALSPTTTHAYIHDYEIRRNG